MPNLDVLHQPYWSTMGPILILSVTAFVVMVLEFSVSGRGKRWLHGVALFGTAAALADAILHLYAKPQAVLATLQNDILANLFTVILLCTTFLVLLFAWDYTQRVPLAPEHTYLILFAVVGALTMVSAVDMVALYVGLEVLSVSSYVLAGLRTRKLSSVEGGIKYLVMGGVSSALLLYGLSFVYGLSGTTNLGELFANQTFTAGAAIFQQYPAITALAFVLILAGLGIKLSLVPFHMWTPDTYAGAPSPVSAMLSTLAKTAAFGMLLRIVLYVFAVSGDNLFYLISLLAAVTMVVGNLIALPQQDMKRLLAYSSVAQAGYVLVPFTMLTNATVVDWGSLVDSIGFYLLAYTFMTVGAFAIVHVVQDARGSRTADALTGLYQQSPWLAGSLTVFLLGLAGMPLTAGFIGKFYIFADTLHLHHAWLGVLLFLTSVVSFYYYFGLIRKLYQPSISVQPARVQPTAAMSALVGLCVLGTIVLGIVPASWLHVLAALT